MEWTAAATTDLHVRSAVYSQVPTKIMQMYTMAASVIGKLGTGDDGRVSIFF